MIELTPVQWAFYFLYHFKIAWDVGPESRASRSPELPQSTTSSLGRRRGIMRPAWCPARNYFMTAKAEMGMEHR